MSSISRFFSLMGAIYKFGIYRKETATEMTIDGSSFYTWACQIANFNNFIGRLVNIHINKSGFSGEVDTIEHLAKSNNLNVDIENMIHRKNIRRYLDLTTALPRDLKRKKRETWIKLLFLGRRSRELSRVIRPFGFKLVCYNMTFFQTTLCKIETCYSSSGK